MSVEFNIFYASAVNKSTRYRLDTQSIFKLLFNCFQYVKLTVRCLLANLWQLPLSLLSIIDASVVFLFKIFFPPQVHIPSALAYRTRAAISVKSVSFLFMAHHTFFYTEIGWHTHMHKTYPISKVRRGEQIWKLSAQRSEFFFLDARQSCASSTSLLSCILHLSSL